MTLLPNGLKGKYDHLIIHATATPADMTEVDAEWVDRAHRRRGWSMCGYHAIITRSGELQHEPTGHRTRPYFRTGAHVGGCGPGWNQRCVGISMAGGVKDDGRTPENNFTNEQMNTLIDWVKAAMHAFDIPLDNVIGHRDLIKMTNASPKACPCFNVRDRVWPAISGYGEGEPEFAPVSMIDTNLRDTKTVRVPKLYTVRAGDTASEIAETHGVPLHHLARLNPRMNLDLIHPGQRIRLLED